MSHDSWLFPPVHTSPWSIVRSQETRIIYQNNSQKRNHRFDVLSSYFTKGSIILVEDESRGFGRISNNVEQPGRSKGALQKKTPGKSTANPVRKKYPGWQFLQTYQDSSDKFWIINPVASIVKAAPGSMRRHQPLQKFVVKSVFAHGLTSNHSAPSNWFSAQNPPSLAHRPRGALMLACPEEKISKRSNREVPSLPAARWKLSSTSLRFSSWNLFFKTLAVTPCFFISTNFQGLKSLSLFKSVSCDFAGVQSDWNSNPRTWQLKTQGVFGVFFDASKIHGSLIEKKLC